MTNIGNQENDQICPVCNQRHDPRSVHLAKGEHVINSHQIDAIGGSFRSVKNAHDEDNE